MKKNILIISSVIIIIAIFIAVFIFVSDKDKNDNIPNEHQSNEYFESPSTDEEIVDDINVQPTLTNTPEEMEVVTPTVEPVTTDMAIEIPDTSERPAVTPNPTEQPVQNTPTVNQVPSVNESAPTEDEEV